MGDRMLRHVVLQVCGLLRNSRGILMEPEVAGTGVLAVQAQTAVPQLLKAATGRALSKACI